MCNSGNSLAREVALVEREHLQTSAIGSSLFPVEVTDLLDQSIAKSLEWGTNEHPELSGFVSSHVVVTLHD